MSKIRRRIVGSFKTELVKKSREAALAAVQIFNNPNITFKSESYIVLMVIAWTYLLHAHYRSMGIEYRYYEQRGQRKRFDKTKHGAYKYWELERCLNHKGSPVDKDSANNLRFLIGLRHEIEHQMSSLVGDVLSARFQACCINYNHYLKELFGEEFGIEKHLAFSLQFSSIGEEQKDLLSDQPGLPTNIKFFIKEFDDGLSEEEYASERYAYRILFVPKTANRKGQADRVIEFVKSDSELADEVNKQYAVIKETERPKYLPAQIIKKMRKEGFTKFSMHNHTQLWRKLDAKNPALGFGTNVAGKHWHWYERWLDEVRTHCKQNSEVYSE